MTGGTGRGVPLINIRLGCQGGTVRLGCITVFTECSITDSLIITIALSIVTGCRTIVFMDDGDNFLCASACTVTILTVAVPGECIGWMTAMI
jgi:hypothetical protein